jgi:hypothetical protein
MTFPVGAFAVDASTLTFFETGPSVAIVMQKNGEFRGGCKMDGWKYGQG